MPNTRLERECVCKRGTVVRTLADKHQCRSLTWHFECTPRDSVRERARRKSLPRKSFASDFRGQSRIEVRNLTFTSCAPIEKVCEKKPDAKAFLERLFASDFPQTEEIGLEIITTAKISTSFHRSPRNFQTSFHGSPTNFKQFLPEVNGSPRHSKKWPREPSNLEMPTFEASLYR